MRMVDFLEGNAWKIVVSRIFVVDLQNMEQEGNVKTRFQARVTVMPDLVRGFSVVMTSLFMKASHYTFDHAENDYYDPSICTCPDGEVFDDGKFLLGSSFFIFLFEYKLFANFFYPFLSKILESA